MKRKWKRLDSSNVKSGPRWVRPPAHEAIFTLYWIEFWAGPVIDSVKFERCSWKSERSIYTVADGYMGVGHRILDNKQQKLLLNATKSIIRRQVEHFSTACEIFADSCFIWQSKQPQAQASDNETRYTFPNTKLVG